MLKPPNAPATFREVKALQSMHGIELRSSECSMLHGALAAATRCVFRGVLAQELLVGLVAAVARKQLWKVEPNVCAGQRGA